MTTNARVHSESTAQFYTPDGKPFYEVAYSDPKKGMRRANLADARKIGALPGPTTILKCLAKPELQSWIVEQTVLAVLTTPRLPGEDEGAFVHRVLHVEKVQDEERDQAAAFGTALHDALSAYFTGSTVPEDMRPWIGPACEALCSRGQLVCSEKVLIGQGYGGRCDLILESPDFWWIIDYKTTKKLPDKGAWLEHRLQLSAYAAAYARMLEHAGHKGKLIRCANCYISSTDTGKYIIWDHEQPWSNTYSRGFVPLLQVWCFVNGYYPPGTQA